MPRLAQSTKNERRKELVDAAWRCVASRGFKTLTIDDVCAEAGVSKGAFYVYFDQKQELLIALLEDEAADIDEMMRRLEDSPIGAVERLRRFTRTMLRRGDDPARLQLRADLWAEMSTDRELRQRWSDVVGARRNRLKRWIESGVSSEELAPIPANALAAILLALGDGLMLHAGLEPAGFRWVNVAKALDSILEGISS